MGMIASNRGMNFIAKLIIYLIRFGLEILCKVDKAELVKIPAEGPLIAYANHTGTVEAPLLFVELYPRKVTGISKIENWNNPLFAWLFDIWHVIPIRRGEADMEAMRQSIDALKEGFILGIAPEGTRSKTTGNLQRAQGGSVMIALRSGAPLQPLAHWGGMHFGSNVKHLKRTEFHVRVGRRFYLDAHGERVTKEIRQQMADEIMWQLAKLLPEEYRGEYADLESATEKYLRFE
jgi:1-acyl-sn-glycerol-3-phosphate acyltransferase